MLSRQGRTLVLAWALLAALPCMADEALAPSRPRLSLTGFGTLGFARSDNGQIQYVRDLSQPDGPTGSWSGKVDSVLGLQANLSLSEQTEGVLQVISRYRYDGSYSPEVAWAFLGHDFSPQLSLRAGRLGTEFYMQADSRLVGYSNLAVRPAPDYYNSLVFSYIDGLDATATLPAAGGLLRGKLFAGFSPEKTPLVKNIPWDLDESLLVGGYVGYLRGPWQLRLGHAQIRLEKEFPLNAVVERDYGIHNFLSAVPELSVMGKWSRFSSLGVVYDEGPLQLQLMLNRIRHDNAFYEDSKAGYAIAAYRVGEVTPFAGYSWVKSSAKTLASPPVAPGLADLVTGLMAQTHCDQHTVFLGARWDLQPNLDLKAQVDWIRGNPSSLFPFREQGMPAWNGKMTVFSLALDFVF